MGLFRLQNLLKAYVQITSGFILQRLTIQDSQFFPLGLALGRTMRAAHAFFSISMDRRECPKG
jgi:hypothetical protein